MKFFPMGDNIYQGFMYLAADQTGLCFSTLIAKSIGLKVGTDYLYPE